MSKVITVNPNLFNFSSVSSRRTKKEKSEKTPKIRVKPPSRPKSTKTVKRSILKFIRNHQDQNYRKLMSSETAALVNGGTEPSRESDSLLNPPLVEPEPSSDFAASVQYLSGLAKEKSLEVDSLRRQQNFHQNSHTLKNRETLSSGYTNTSTTRPVLQTPVYGCMKNGTLPTYRQYSRTLRTSQTPLRSPPVASSAIATGSAIIGGEIDRALKIAPDARASKALELLQFKKHAEVASRPRPKLRRKTVRKRTFRVGKSKVHPKVAVLVSNKTMRSRITTDAQLLKQTPMSDVKQYLRKHGLIKVGGTTPNDVLRQMYESAKTMCGEVCNHNPDTLLYNFLNDEDLVK